MAATKVGYLKGGLAGSGGRSLNFRTSICRGTSELTAYCVRVLGSLADEPNDAIFCFFFIIITILLFDHFG